MSTNMSDWVGLADFIPGGGIRMTQGFDPRGQMFGMGDYLPGQDFVTSPDSSIYARQQMFGMGLGAASVEAANSELDSIKEKRASIAQQIAAIENKGKRAARAARSFAPGEPSPAAPTQGSGAKALLVLVGLGLAWKAFGPK
jgi:hypothetical protein